jgi:hypothetical protein
MTRGNANGRRGNSPPSSTFGSTHSGDSCFLFSLPPFAYRLFALSSAPSVSILYFCRSCHACPLLSRMAAPEAGACMGLKTTSQPPLFTDSTAGRRPAWRWALWTAIVALFSCLGATTQHVLHFETLLCICEADEGYCSQSGQCLTCAKRDATGALAAASVSNVTSGTHWRRPSAEQALGECLFPSPSGILLCFPSGSLSSSPGPNGQICGGNGTKVIENKKSQQTIW